MNKEHKDILDFLYRKYELFNYIEDYQMTLTGLFFLQSLSWPKGRTKHLLYSEHPFVRDAKRLGLLEELDSSERFAVTDKGKEIVELRKSIEKL